MGRAACRSACTAQECERRRRGLQAAVEHEVCIAVERRTALIKVDLVVLSSQATRRLRSVEADDSEDEAIGGGKAGEAEDISFSLDDLSQSQN